jgi:hypothetical protein
VRQQWNFSPPNTIREIEECQLRLSDMVPELIITPDVSHGTAHASLKSIRLRCSCRESIDPNSMRGQKTTARSEFPRADIGFFLEKLDVFCLEALGPLDYIKLHRLAFLKAAESIRLNGREMHENIRAGLTADEPEALGVVKPLYCSLFQFVTCFYFEFLLKRIAASERADATAEPTVNCG